MSGEQDKVWIMYCQECGKPVEEEAVFCSNCGILLDSTKENSQDPVSSFSTEIIEKKEDNYNGKRGDAESKGNKKYFYGDAVYASEVGRIAQRFLQSKDMETQIIEGEKIVVQGRKKSGLIRKMAGLELSATVQIVPEGNDLLIVTGNAQWLDKAVGGVIGLCLFAPFFVTAGWGAYQQHKLFPQIEKEIENFLATKK